MPYYLVDLKVDPNLENYPYGYYVTTDLKQLRFSGLGFRGLWIRVQAYSKSLGFTGLCFGLRVLIGEGALCFRM